MKFKLILGDTKITRKFAKYDMYMSYTSLYEILQSNYKENFPKIIK